MLPYHAHVQKSQHFIKSKPEHIFLVSSYKKKGLLCFINPTCLLVNVGQVIMWASFFFPLPLTDFSPLFLQSQKTAEETGKLSRLLPQPWRIKLGRLDVDGDHGSFLESTYFKLCAQRDFCSWTIHSILSSQILCCPLGVCIWNRLQPRCPKPYSLPTLSVLM